MPRSAIATRFSEHASRMCFSNTSMLVLEHAYMYVYIYIYICRYMQVYIDIYSYTNMSICMCIHYVYIYILIFLYIYIYMYICRSYSKTIHGVAHYENDTCGRVLIVRTYLNPISKLTTRDVTCGPSRVCTFAKHVCGPRRRMIGQELFS